jgi:predicted regulator of Ras-like GTPase activity (Roadblock/LC7/MglB family)
MKIPFFDLFKKSIPRFQTRPVHPRPVPTRPSPVAKAEGDRLSKTVMPNITRTVAPEETSEAVTLEAPVAKPRTVSFGPAKKKGNKDLPPAVALALEPRVERAVSLELSDIVPQLPAGLAKPLESLDSSRRILLKASELEKGMAAGKPSVSLGSICQQAPEIFMRPVAATDTTQIALPFNKVLEAIMQMQVRRDQLRDQAVPQVETPFLKATLEDNERFGLPSEPPQTWEMPPMRLEPATAETIAAAEPETMFREKFIPTPQTADQGPDTPLRIPLVDDAAKENAIAPGDVAGKAAPERILFQLPPKETGVPASERVPASCGPPVSTPLPRPPEPTRIPFKIPSKTPSAEGPPKRPVSVSMPTMGDRERHAEKKISLALKPILQNLPVFELTADPKEAPEHARIEFPFSLIESQLITGRVVVSPALFEKSLPPDCRRFFSAKDLQMPVSLPLQEVLKNLPSEALQMRADQEERETAETFETPFSTTAEEDAKRFKIDPAPIAKSTVVEEAPPLAGAAPDAKSVIAQASQLPGVRACAMSFADGLSLAGNLPAEIGAEALCAIAPSLLERIETHVRDTQIGDFKAMTLHCAKSTVTFFRRANVCLAALHANGELTPSVREQLARMLEGISRIYSQPEVTHVHH